VPELPDLVHVALRLDARLAGRRIEHARTGDPTVLRLIIAEPFPACLVGKTVARVERRGHFLVFPTGGLTLVVNCMLAGRFELDEGGKRPATSRTKTDKRVDKRSLALALGFGDGIELRYLDELRMGKIYVAPDERLDAIPVFNQLGQDVLSPAFTAEAFAALIAGRRDQVRQLLLDKTALASIGNAYADEILFAARLHPKTFCNKLGPAEVGDLHAAIGSVLRSAIDEIRRQDPPVQVKVRDFLAVRGRDQQPCPRCGTKIRTVRVGDGDACFCPTCQPATRQLFVDFRKVTKHGGPP
jgi:formamidopyrimidine-DNA glycosylase